MGEIDLAMEMVHEVLVVRPHLTTHKRVQFLFRSWLRKRGYGPTDKRIEKQKYHKFYDQLRLKNKQTNKTKNKIGEQNHTKAAMESVMMNDDAKSTKIKQKIKRRKQN